MRDSFFDVAVAEARLSLAAGGVPVGAALVRGGRLLGRGHNTRVQTGSPIHHGEMSALAGAGRQPAAVYRECVLYTTLSPCSMCAGAILLYGIPKVVIGENRSFRGEEDWLRSRGVELLVLDDAECLGLMQSFMAAHPEVWNEDIGV